jgi:maltooligosyltrehalose trehalohydrolase
MLDPQSPEAFDTSKLNWRELEDPKHRDMLSLYRELIALRRRHPSLSDPRLDLVRVEHSEDIDDDRWLSLTRGQLRVVANLGSQPVELGLERTAEVLFATGPDVQLSETTVSLPGETGVVLTLGRLLWR